MNDFFGKEFRLGQLSHICFCIVLHCIFFVVVISFITGIHCYFVLASKIFLLAITKCSLGYLN